MFTQSKKPAKQVLSAGYTLIELLIYFALVSLMFVQLSSLYLSILEAKSQSHALSAVERDGQYIFSRLTYDIQRADDIVEPALLGGESSTLRLMIDGQEYIYTTTANRLTLSRGGNPLDLHTQTTLSNFSVRRLGNTGGKHTIQLQYTITSPIVEHTGQETRDFQTTVGIR